MKNNNIFPYFVGINSLEEVATKENKVVVINILGNESRKVTKISHAFSGGNIVAGVQYGRAGKLETPIGNIPVYSRLAEVVDNHKFDTGVVYLPPAAVFYAVNELLRYKRIGKIDLKKIVLVTEKISVKHQRMIRAVCQREEVDVFGANALGLADSWNHIRIGGALGGDSPEETLIKGSVAIHSNSGNFSNTIAEYMKTTGFGTTTIVSSGKDIIIQFAAAEFLYAAQNDPRTKAVVLYVEPGGFYEKQAIDWINEGSLKFDKPMVVCVTGRWKSKLTKSVGHAGALAGAHDDAISKEEWFDTYFEKPVFNPDKPENISEKGIRVSSIQHIPQALEEIYKLKNWETDFEPKGNLQLKPWMGNDMNLHLPPNLDIDVVEAISPYNKQIKEAKKELGAVFLRQNMRNASSASQINKDTQIAELHGFPIINLIDHCLECNMIFALTKVHPKKDELYIANICLNYLGRTYKSITEAVEIAEKNGSTPNQALMVGASMLGNNENFKIANKYSKILLDIIGELSIKTANNNIDYNEFLKEIEKQFDTTEPTECKFTKYLVDEVKDKFSTSSLSAIVARYIRENNIYKADVLLISAIFIQLAFESLLKKKISRDRVENMYSFISTQMQMLNLMAIDHNNPKLKKLNSLDEIEFLSTSVTEIAYYNVFNEEANPISLYEFKTLLALTITNGSGTISAKGAKESVSARNNISTAFAGFLSNTGLSHGGSGYEAIEFLIESLNELDINEPSDDFNNLEEIATKVAIKYKDYKEEQKRKGNMVYKRIPCVNHPVFKGKKVNIDPREDFIFKKFKKQNINNVFWDFYHELVNSLYKNKVTSNVYCVNIDAVIAVIALKLMWKSYKANKISDINMQKIGFIIFLIGRMIGVSAEIADHRERGTDMDCRTPLKDIKFVV